MAPQRTFKYDVVALLEAIRDRPMLWDKTLEIYKDKVERKIAWDEICNILDRRYEHMSEENKRATYEHVTNKWTNIRDTFVRTIRNKNGKPKKKYLLYNHLRFLLKVIPEYEVNKDCEENNSSEDPSFLQDEVECETEETFTPSKIKRDSTEEYIPKRKKRRSVKSEDSFHDSDDDPYLNGTSNIDFVEIDSKVESDPRVMNEDEAFFASLLPTVVKYNEDERLEFRIDVLSVMKKIKDKKKWQ